MSGEQAGQGEQKQEPYQEVTAGTQARDGEGGEGSGEGKADGFDSASWDECCSKLSLALGQ